MESTEPQQTAEESSNPPQNIDPEYSDYKTSSNETALEEYLSNEVTLRWSRVFIVSIVVAVVLVSVTLLFCLIIKNAVNLIFLFLPWIFLIEFGLLFIFGGCIGTVKQSFTIGVIRARLTRGERVTGADTKIAIGSAYTYIFAGIYVSLASLISWLIIYQ